MHQPQERALGLSVGAVSKYLRALRACGIEGAEAETLSESELEQRVFGSAPAVKPGRSWRRTERGSTGSSSATGT
jgi:hypothetical protein